MIYTFTLDTLPVKVKSMNEPHEIRAGRVGLPNSRMTVKGSLSSLSGALIICNWVLKGNAQLHHYPYKCPLQNRLNWCQ